MADLSRDDVIKLGQLVRIELSDDEITEYTRELAEVLRYVEQLQSVDTAGLKPTVQTSGLHNVMRDDEVRDYGYTADELLAGSLSVEQRQLKVRRMLG